MFLDVCAFCRCRTGALVLQAMEPLGRGRFTSQMRSFNWMALGINVVFHLLHFVNTHSTYDGLAQDVSIASSQGGSTCIVARKVYGAQA